MLFGSSPIPDKDCFLCIYNPDFPDSPLQHDFFCHRHKHYSTLRFTSVGYCHTSFINFNHDDAVYFNIKSNSKFYYEIIIASPVKRYTFVLCDIRSRIRFLLLDAFP